MYSLVIYISECTQVSTPTIGGASQFNQSGTGVTEKVYYDSKFTSVEKVFDSNKFRQKTKSNGFDFGEYDPTLNALNDWVLAEEDFYSTQQKHMQ